MFDVNITHLLTLSCVLFCIGAFGIAWNRRHLILMLLCIELLLLAANLNFLAFARLHGSAVGLIFSMLLLAIAAAETAIGLAIIVVYFKTYNTVSLSTPPTLRG